MTELSAEILRDWQVRKSKEQKSRFIALMQSRIPGLRVEEGGFPRCRNLVLGDVDNADLVLTAHYDTCARLPFPNFITPKNLLIYLLYNLLIALPFVLLGALFGFLLVRFTPLYPPLAAMLATLLMLAATLYVFLFGPANPHTVNDNTSGVLTLVELMAALSEEEKARTAFVFFDHEESGLFGSAFFASRHKKAMKEKLLINFDCVSDGDHILVVPSRKARKLGGEALRAAFVGSESKTVHLERPGGAFYPSDQVNFPCGVGVAAMNKKPLLGLYMGRIHTPRDTVCDETNFAFLCACMKRFYAQW